MAPKPEPTLAHDLAARVAAWHNRHPFAQRITPAQVHGVGVVALPFLGADASAAAAAAAVAVGKVAAAAGNGDDTLPFALPAVASTTTSLAAPDRDDAASLPERAAARLQADGVGAAADTAAPANLAGDLAGDVSADVTADAATAGAADIAAPAGNEPADAGAGLAAESHRVTPSRWAWLRAWRPWRRRRSAAARGAWLPAFSEDFIAPITPAQAARFALRHGLSQRSGAADWPQRDVLADGPASPRQVTVYLGTAAIEVGDRRLRVLVGGGPRPAVIGPRLWSRPRAGAAAALGLAGAAIVLALRWPPTAPHETLAALPPLPASAASAAAAASAPIALVMAAASAAGLLPSSVPASSTLSSPLPSPSSAPQADGSSETSSAASPAGTSSAASPAGAASAASPAAVALAAANPGEPTGRARAASSPAGVASAPVPAASAAGAASAPAPFPDIRPRLSTEQRQQARQQAEELRAQLPPRASAAGGAARAATSASTSAAAADGRVFALVTRTTRGRAASEVMQSLMVTAAAGATWPGQPRTEVLQVPQGWRAAWWPFGSPADAELAREALAVYGINAEIVEF